MQRGGCIVVRNLVARNPEYRQLAIDADALLLVQAARANHPYCDDVAYAAIRDLENIE